MNPLFFLRATNSICHSLYQEKIEFTSICSKRNHRSAQTSTDAFSPPCTLMLLQAVSCCIRADSAF